MVTRLPARAPCIGYCAPCSGVSISFQGGPRQRNIPTVRTNGFGVAEDAPTSIGPLRQAHLGVRRRRARATTPCRSSLSNVFGLKKSNLGKALDKANVDGCPKERNLLPNSSKGRARARYQVMKTAFAIYLILQATTFGLAGIVYWKDCIRRHKPLRKGNCNDDD